MSEDQQKLQAVERLQYSDKYILLCENYRETFTSYAGLSAREIIGMLENLKYQLLKEVNSQ